MSQDSSLKRILIPTMTSLLFTAGVFSAFLVIEGNREGAVVKSEFLRGQQVTDQRLHALENRLVELENRLTTLTQVISPKNADEILTVARMKQEVLERATFENEVEKKVSVFDSRMSQVEDRYDALLYWIWATLLTIIVGLLSAVIFLMKRLGTKFSSVLVEEGGRLAPELSPLDGKRSG